jgi:hypothetical protein
MIKIKLPKKIKNLINVKSNDDVIRNNQIVSKMFPEIVLDSDIRKRISLEIVKKDIRVSKIPHTPDLADLYVLYNLIYLNNRINILEYGCGSSSIAILKALKDIKKKKNSTHYTRVKKPYNLTIMDDNNFFLNKAKKKIINSQYYNKNVNFHFSNCVMTKYNNKYVTEYSSHALVNPDFIYLDGPSHVNIKGKINNFTVKHFEMMPMVSDILKYENFLVPGTIILTDGRANNVRFLLNNFQRKWKYYQLEWNDNHILYLDEKPLGTWNKEQIKFYNSK